MEAVPVLRSILPSGKKLPVQWRDIYIITVYVSHKLSRNRVYYTKAHVNDEISLTKIEPRYLQTARSLVSSFLNLIIT